MIIKLTHIDDDRSIFINSNNIISFSKNEVSNNEYTIIFCLGSSVEDRFIYSVKETPEEILKLIKEAN